MLVLPRILLQYFSLAQISSIYANLSYQYVKEQWIANKANPLEDIPGPDPEPQA